MNCPRPCETCRGGTPGDLNLCPDCGGGYRINEGPCQVTPHLVRSLITGNGQHFIEYLIPPDSPAWWKECYGTVGVVADEDIEEDWSLL